jgi:hypothetical protein
MVFVIEYKNNKPIAQYTLSGVSAGLSFIEEQESIYKDRTYRVSNKKILPKPSALTRNFLQL